MTGTKGDGRHPPPWDVGTMTGTHDPTREEGVISISMRRSRSTESIGPRRPGTMNGTNDDDPPSHEKTHENVCDYCRRTVRGKTREQMFRRLEYAYCSTDCTKRHHQALDAEDVTATGQVGTTAEASYDGALVTHNITPGINFDVNGFGSPPITPSAALLHHHKQVGTHYHQRGRIDTNGNEKHFFPTNVPSNQMDFIPSDEKLNSNDENDDSVETDYCTTFSTGTSSVIPGPGGHAAISNIRSGKYRHGTSNESRDYNDELARQLRLAAREDELTSKERAYQRQKIVTARYDAADSSSGAFGTPGTYSSLSSNATASGYSDMNVGESSPGYYAQQLTNSGAIGSSNNTAYKNDRHNSSSDGRKNRRHHPSVKPNECSTPTESTQSLSSSSHGGFSNLDIESLNAGLLQQRGTASSQPNNSKNSSFSPPRQSNVDSDNINDGGDFIVEAVSMDSWEINSKQSNSGLSRAFEELSGWTTGGMIRDDAKTPRVGNHRNNFGWHSDDAHDCRGSSNANNADPGQWRDVEDERNPASYEGQKVIYSTYNKNYARHVSSLSDTSLHAIDEDRPADLSFELLAQKRGLRPTNASQSFNGKSPSIKKSPRVDHAVEDVVSVVSYYDDPSFDMFSLATNDTMTTMSTIGPIQKHQRGRTSSKSTSKSSGADRELMLKRTIKTKAKGSNIIVQRHQHTKSDPPGILIDDIVKDGIQRRQQRFYNNRRDPSRDPSHGVDPEGIQQLMENHENVKEEKFRIKANVMGDVHLPQNGDQHRLSLRGISTSDSIHQYSQRLQPQDPFSTGIDPSVYGKEPDDKQQSMHLENEEEKKLIDEHGNQNSHSSQRHDQERQHVPDFENPQMGSKPAEIRQRQKQQSYSQYDSHLWQDYEHFTENLENSPPQLRPSRQELQFQENGHADMNVAQGHKQVYENKDGQFDRDESGGFNVADIEYSISEKDDNYSKLTGELEDEPSVRGDDDTATNTLDTVDLVTEVKRVWRHVQRYEKKKHLKKQLKRQYLSNNHGEGDVPIDDNYLSNVDQDGNKDEMQGNDPVTMNSKSLQSSQVCTPLKYKNDDCSKVSDITPSPLPQEKTGYGRGRASDRPPMTPTDGRLGSHIRSTSSHSRAHTPHRDSAEMDSTHAMASQASTCASTEKDVVFLNEGVDEFYEGRVKQRMKQYQHRNAGTKMAHHSRPTTSPAQSQLPTRSGQARTQFVNGAQRTTPHTLGKYPAHSVENGYVLTQEEHNELLSQPYDMTKVKSTGTSITHATQQASNVSTAPHVLRSEMARKFMKQRQGVKSNAAAAPKPQEDYQRQNSRRFDRIEHTTRGNGYSNR
ncbi:hypothetical protein ACHAXA_000430 [Cyclostephanos tholiformis]|uniref:Vms1-associating treble clef domain-containing protein n=1 Tax=Cyclostephanos tholiformis TaxID=382380 RepID=A0ABD3R9Z9_9STRA